jgi:hypothetical protein
MIHMIPDKSPIIISNLGKQKLKQVIKYQYQLPIQCSKVDPCIRYTIYNVRTPAPSIVPRNYLVQKKGK